MKKLVMLFSILVIVCNLFSFAGGDGTAGDPYLVSNATELNDVRNYLDSHFMQTGNIDLNVDPYNTGEGWLPILLFTGVYDGNSYDISNLYINRPSTQNNGLFGSTGHGVIIKNLGVTNADVVGQVLNGILIGSITGAITISKCYTTGTIHGTHMYTGGFIGSSRYAQISDCYSTATVTSTNNYVGGFIGQAKYTNSNYTNCYSSGSISSNNNFVGGFMGSFETGSNVINCFWDTEISGQSSSAAGTGKTTAEMKQQSTYSGWDFTNTWEIDANTNSGYPYLKSGTEDALPVTLSSFSGSFTNGSSLLAWSTVSESNNMGWNIYRSTTENIEESTQANSTMIEGAGTTTEPTAYSFEDQADCYESELYWFWIESVALGGTTQLYGPVSVTITEDGEDPDAPEIAFKTKITNYPNPFNPNTQFYFSLKDGEEAEKIEIFNTRGQGVKTIESPANPQLWNGENNSGAGVSSGIYMYKLTTNRKSYVKKMVLSK